MVVPDEQALAIRDDVAFFQAVRAALVKSGPSGAKPEEDLEHAIRQLLTRAIASDQVIDIFAAATQETGYIHSVRCIPGRGPGIATEASGR